ncbi:MAG: DUF1761 domain-containing protein [Pseudomonadota bacterium]
MPTLSILVAALAGFIFGAVWYSIFAKPWMAASGVATVDDRPANQKDPAPYIISLVSVVLVAGMMRHMFDASGVEDALRGLGYGAGLGAFIAAPWLATNYGFAGRPFRLTLIDAGYAIGGSGTIGLVLNLMR